MNVIVRFYWQHDLDLVALAMHPDFDMAYWIRLAVLAEARGKGKFHIPLPKSVPYSIKLESCYIHFPLDAETDADVIDFLYGIRAGFRNSQIKLIFRKYLDDQFFDVFLQSDRYETKSRAHKQTTRRKKRKGVTAKPVRPSGTYIKPAGKAAFTEEIAETTIQETATEEKADVLVQVPEQEPVMDLSAEPVPEESADFDLFGAIEGLMG